MMAIARMDARQAAVREGLLAMLVEAGTTDAETVVDGIVRTMDDAARRDRRRLQDAARNAFQEGFLTGRNMPRIARYSIQMWKGSRIAQRIDPRQPAEAAINDRYARYNEV